MTVVHGHLRDAGGDAREHDADRSTGSSARTSSTRPKAATRCSGSTCSGSSAIPRSTSSSSRRSGWCRRSSPTFARRPMFGYRAMVLSLIATGVPRLRPVGAPHVRDRPAAARRELLHRRSMMIAIPSGVQIFCWIATLWTGRLELDDAAAVRARLLRHLRHRRPDRRDARLGAARPAGARHVSSSSRTSTTC